jgi:hypothetical protein
MNVEARIEKVETGIYETFVCVSRSSIPGISLLSIFNPKGKVLSVGDFISVQVKVCFVSRIVPEPDNSPHYFRQALDKNGTEICGIVESLTHDGGFICKMSAIGCVLVELESITPPPVGTTVSFTGELRAEL